MAEKLTDRTAKTSSFANDDVIHVVDVSDTSQDPAGSSFKSALGDIYGSYLAPKITSAQIVTNAADNYSVTLADTVSSNHYLFLQTDSGDPFVDVTVTSYANPKDGAILVIRLNRAGTDDLSIPGFSAGSGFSAGIYTARYSSTAVSWLPVNYASISAVNLQSVTDNGNSTTNNIEFGAGAGIILDNGSILREGTIDAGTGGTKGIAQICAVGYELKWEAGSQYVMDGNGLLIREVNHKFYTAPTVTNDDTEGFYFGSRWILDDGTIYTCTDASTGAAVWEINGEISGQFTPIITNDGIYINHSNESDINYFRHGNLVTLSGYINIIPITNGGTGFFKITNLPINSTSGYCTIIPSIPNAITFGDIKFNISDVTVASSFLNIAIVVPIVSGLNPVELFYTITYQVL